jgi:hypothetical protein
MTRARHCRACGSIDPPSGWKTRGNMCKACDNLRQRAYYRAHAEQCRQAARRYRQSRVMRERRRSYVERKRARGVKLLVGARLTSAVYAGRIVKPNACQGCQRQMDKDKLHGHHADYGKPLDVEWLCAACHGKRHRKYA